MRCLRRDRLIGVLIVAVIAPLFFMTTGCGVDGFTRQAEFTHWYDEDTIILVYTRQQTMGALSGIVRPAPKTTHVSVCTVAADNSLDCEEQRVLNNILNSQLSEKVDLEDRFRP